MADARMPDGFFDEFRMIYADRGYDVAGRG